MSYYKNFLIFLSITFIILYYSITLFIDFKNKFKLESNKLLNNIENIYTNFNSLQKNIKNNTITLKTPEEKISSFKIIDLNNKIIAEIIPDNFISSKKYNIDSPEVLSLITIEDSNFFNRESIINIKGFIRALYKNLVGDKQGGSGITQQIVKNFFLKQENGLTRKFKEVFITYNLEKKYSKLEIINFYLNNINYGKNIFGIQQAGEIYLGKKDLSIEDSFILNSMLKKPSYFFENQNELKQRAKYYYKKYCEYNICNLQQGIQYIDNIKLNYNINNKRIGNPFIIDMVLKNKDKIDKNILNTGKVVINYKERDDYKKIDDLILNWSKTACKKYNTCDFGAIVLNKEGVIEYLYSGDYNKNQVNVLTSELQPGSTMKPFIYTKYLEIKNIKTTDVYFSNSQICIGNWCPSNWNNKSGGKVSFQTAIDLSLNLPVLHIYKEMGSNITFNLLSDLGLFDKNEKVGDSFIIGGYGVLPINLANAYRIFLNGGKYQEFSLFENKEYKQILNESKVNLTKKVLYNNIDFGKKFGVKTGTTNNWKDEYIVLFNNNKVILVWGGNKNGKPTKPGIYSIPKLKPVVNILIENFMKE